MMNTTSTRTRTRASRKTSSPLVEAQAEIVPPPQGKVQADEQSVPAAAANPVALALQVQCDGQTLTLTATDQISLRVGKASIVLHADGRIELRGTELLSRASGQNAVRGASISLN